MWTHASNNSTGNLITAKDISCSTEDQDWRFTTLNSESKNLPTPLLFFFTIYNIVLRIDPLEQLIDYICKYKNGNLTKYKALNPELDIINYHSIKKKEADTILLIMAPNNPITWRINHLFTINFQYRHLLVIRPFNLLFADGVNLHNFVWNFIVIQECWETEEVQWRKESRA